MPMGKKANQSLYGSESSTREPAAATRVDGGELVSRVLESQGVKYLFAINGGHTFPILATLREHGIKLIHMRHEQACAYAADAYARTSGAPGVCSVTAGCGLTNAVTGLCGAGLAGSAVVCIAGQHPTTRGPAGVVPGGIRLGGLPHVLEVHQAGARLDDDRGRPAPGVSRGDDSAAGRFARRDPDQHPVRAADDATEQRRGAKVVPPDELRVGRRSARRSSAPRAVAVCRAAVALRRATAFFGPARPRELGEFAELTGIPAYARRTGQGALPEDHPLAIRGVWKKPFTGRADVVLAIGFRFWSGEKFGEPPTWSDKARYIQVDATPNRIGLHVPAELADRRRPEARASPVDRCRPSGSVSRGRRTRIRSGGAKSPRCGPITNERSTRPRRRPTSRRRFTRIDSAASSASSSIATRPW